MLFPAFSLTTLFSISNILGSVLLSFIKIRVFLLSLVFFSTLSIHCFVYSKALYIGIIISTFLIVFTLFSPLIIYIYKHHNYMFELKYDIHIYMLNHLVQHCYIKLNKLLPFSCKLVAFLLHFHFLLVLATTKRTSH